MKLNPRGGLLILVASTALACGSNPGAGNVQASPTASGEAVATGTPRTTGTPRPTAQHYVAPIEPGDALPDELIGAWYEPAGRLDTGSWNWFLRGGDEYCFRTMHTTQDCMVFVFEGATADTRSEGAIVTMVDGVITHKLIRGACHEQVAGYTYTLADDVLTMTVIPSCVTDDYRFFRAGTNGAPPAPPAPVP